MANPAPTIATRASNCSERLRTKCGQFSVPGISSCRLLIIWQPLHTPRAKLSLRSKNARNRPRAGIEQNRLGPALASAEHVAVGEAAAGDDTLNSSS